MLTTKKRISVGRPKKQINPAQLEIDVIGILDAMSQNEDSAAMIKTMLSVKKQGSGQWRGMLAVPPAGLADLIIGEFRQKTNIPLEIPFFTLLSVLSGLLLKKGTILKTESMGDIRPDIWTVILASSGAGKTYSQKKITDSIDIKTIEFCGTGIVSGAAFVQALEAQPDGLWVRDEFAQFLKKVESDDGPMGEMKDYMLQLYDNSRIERKTKKETITIESPALAILGLTVLETFGQHVSMESMLDGFAQRFSYVKAEPDPARPWRNYPLWKVDNSLFQRAWDKVIGVVKKEYYVDEDIITPAFSVAFQSLFNDAVPESFYRRLIWRASKYAMIYHVLRADDSDRLTAEDFGWAARVISMHVQDAAWLIGEHNLGGLEKIIVSTENAVKRLAEKHGRPPTLREIVQNVSAIKNVAQARQILDLINIDH